MAAEDFRPYWNDIARDLVLTRMPQHGPTALRSTVEDVISEYGLTADDAVELFIHPEFEEIIALETEKAEGYGSDAAHVYMVRDMTTDFSVRLHKRMSQELEKLEPKDLLKYYEILLRAAGWLEQQKVKEAAGALMPAGKGPQINVQVINVPKLENTKLNHLLPNAIQLEAEVVEEIDGEFM